MVASRAAYCLFAIGLLLAGCGAQAGSEPALSVAPTSVTTATTVAALAAPCELLSSVDRSTAGLTSVGEPKTIGTARACDWTETGMFGVTVTADDTAGIADLKVDDPKPVTVGRHQAEKSVSDGECALVLPAGERSSVQVDVTNANFRDTDLACRRATTVAQLIEPKLP